MSKVILITFFFFISLFSFLYCDEKNLGSIVFSSDKTTANAVLINTKLKRYIKIKENQVVELQEENSWVIQVQYGDKRLTLLFSVKKNKKTTIFVDFENNSIINLSTVPDEVVSLHSEVKGNIKRVLDNNSHFINNVNKYNMQVQFKDDIKKYNKQIDLLQQTNSNFQRVWNLSSLLNQKKEIDNLIQSILKMREQIVILSKNKYAEQVIGETKKYVTEAKNTNKFDYYLDKINEKKIYFISTKDDTNLQKIIKYSQLVIDLKRQFRQNILSKLEKTKIISDMKYSQINSGLKLLDSLMGEVNKTESNFTNLSQKISQLKKSLLNKKTVYFKEYYEKNREKIFKYFMYSTASVSLSIAVIFMSLGIASFTVRNYYVNNFNVAKIEYDSATNMIQISQYNSEMQDSMTKANNFYTIGLVSLPISSVFLVSGVFLYFVDVIVKKVRQWKARQNNYSFAFRLNENYALFYFGFKL